MALDTHSRDHSEHLFGRQRRVRPAAIVPLRDPEAILTRDEAVRDQHVADGENDQLPESGRAGPWDDLDLTLFGQRGPHAVAA